MNRTVGLLEPRHASEVSELRIREYQKAAGFTAPLEALVWGEADECHPNIGVWEGNRLIATMRLEMHYRPDTLEYKLECPWQFGDIRYPVMLLSRAATDSAYRGQGLNTVLRYWALKLAELWSVPYLVGTLVEGSPRENLMRQMGYEFFQGPGWNQSAYQSDRPVLVAKLSLRKNALHALQAAARVAKVSPEEGHYPWVGPRPSVSAAGTA